MTKNSKIKRRHLYRITTVISLINIVVWGIVATTEFYKGRVMPGTAIDGIAIGGKTIEQAEEIVMTAKLHQLAQPVTITAEDIATQASPKSFGASINQNAVKYYVTENTRPRSLLTRLKAKAGTSPSLIIFTDEPLTLFITTLKSQVDKPAHGASLSYTNGSITEQSAVYGRELNPETAKETIIDTFSSRVPHQISLSVTVVAPMITNTNQMATARTNLEKLLAQPLVLSAQNKTIIIPPADIFDLLSFGISHQELAYDIDQEKATKYITALAKKVYVAPVNKLVATNGTTLVEGRDGIELNKIEAYKTISLAVITPSSEPVELATSTITRRTTKDSGDFYDLNRSDGKYVDISVSKQRLALIENNQLVKIYAVSTGKWNTPTPIGDFSIVNHIRTARSALFPELYMDDWMAITPDGDYGIHRLPRYANGSWIEDPAHIGKPLSHGCIRLAPGESTEVYNWAINGTKVFIHN